MPNIASVLKAEIVRLAKKEVRAEVEALRKASAQYRSEIAALKRRVAALERTLGRLERKGPRPAAAAEPVGKVGRIRFSAQRLAAQRQKLGLSAAAMGALLGVSTQSVYHWESGKTRPRAAQLAAIAELRKVGKREAKARLAAMQD